MRQIYSILLFVLFANVLPGQNVNYPIENTGLYDFVNEMANMGHIQLNSASKPYSRREIAEWLHL